MYIQRQKVKRYVLGRKVQRRVVWVGAGSFSLLLLGMVGVILMTRSLTSVAVTPTAVKLPVTINAIQLTPPAAQAGSTPATNNGGGTAVVKPSQSAPAAAAGQAASTANWSNLPLFADPANSATAYAAANAGAPGASIIARLGQQPIAAWFGGWNGDVAADASAYVSKAAAARSMPVMVAYNIPNRDCGGYSAGGAQTEADYAAWIARLANGIGNNPAVVILEPDAISLQTCLNADQLAARNRELANAISTLAGGSNTRVYLDAGHSGWLSADETAGRLKAAGIANASGFALNISNFGTTASNTDYGTQVSKAVGGKHFVIDTSRNGTGPAADGQWCNPAGRALGAAPTTNTGNPLVDAYLWIKTPWQSDGACSGAPAAGADYWSYALSLAQAAGW